MYTVYKHTAPGGKVYIGITSQTVAQRWGTSGQRYCKSVYFSRAIKKYGWENIQHEIIAEGLTKAQATALEIELIAKYDSTNPEKGYNCSTGGEASRAGAKASAETRQKQSAAHRGKSPSAETRQKLSDLQKGIPKREETCKKISEALKGKSPSAETRQRQSEAQRGKTLSAETRQKIREAQKGRTVSEETRQKLSQIHKGKVISEDQRQKLSEALKGKPSWNKGKTLSPEHRQKLSEARTGTPAPNRKAVICLETGAIYSSILEATKATGIAHISSVCRGKLKTAGGYHWKYI